MSDRAEREETREQVAEQWHAPSVVDALNRIQDALARINRESLKNGHAIQRAWPGFFPLVSNVLEMEKTLKAVRDSAPCKQWLHDGSVYCTMHKYLRKDDDSTGDCPGRVCTPEPDR